MGAFLPALGQMAFGQPWQDHNVPEIMHAVFMSIDAELDRVMGNKGIKHVRPFENSSASFKCDAFTVCSYSWSDAVQPYNFKHHETGLVVSWYKWCGRGMSADRDITPDLAAVVLDDCLKAIKAVEAGAEWSEPGLYPEGELIVEVGPE